jgi:hypothetical protein
VGQLFFYLIYSRIYMLLVYTEPGANDIEIAARYPPPNYPID